MSLFGETGRGCNGSPFRHQPIVIVGISEVIRRRAIGAGIVSRSQALSTSLRIRSKNPPWKPVFCRLTGRGTLPMFRAISSAALRARGSA